MRREVSVVTKSLELDLFCEMVREFLFLKSSVKSKWNMQNSEFYEF